MQITDYISMESLHSDDTDNKQYLDAVASLEAYSRDYDKLSKQINRLDNDTITLESIYDSLSTSLNNKSNHEYYAMLNLSLESAVSKYGIDVSHYTVSLEDETLDEPEQKRGVMSRIGSAIRGLKDTALRALAGLYGKLIEMVSSAKRVVAGLRSKFEALTNLERSAEAEGTVKLSSSTISRLVVDNNVATGSDFVNHSKRTCGILAEAISKNGNPEATYEVLKGIMGYLAQDDSDADFNAFQEYVARYASVCNERIEASDSSITGKTSLPEELMDFTASKPLLGNIRIEFTHVAKDFMSRVLAKNYSLDELQSEMVKYKSVGYNRLTIALKYLFILGAMFVTWNVASNTAIFYYVLRQPIKGMVTEVGMFATLTRLALMFRGTKEYRTPTVQEMIMLTSYVGIGRKKVSRSSLPNDVARLSSSQVSEVAKYAIELANVLETSLSQEKARQKVIKQITKTQGLFNAKDAKENNTSLSYMNSVKSVLKTYSSMVTDFEKECIKESCNTLKAMYAYCEASQK